MRIIFLLLAAVLFPVGLVIPCDDADEFAAMKKIEFLGGKVTRSYDGQRASVVAIRFETGAKFSDKFGHLLWYFEQLSELDLGDTRVTDALLAELAALPNLERLVLGGGDFNLTDEQLRRLSELKKLEAIKLWGMQLQIDRFRRIRELLPNVTVTQSGCRWSLQDKVGIGAGFVWAVENIEARTDSMPLRASLKKSKIDPEVMALTLVMNGNEIVVDVGSILMNQNKIADVPVGAETIRICEHCGNLQIAIDGRAVHKSTPESRFRQDAFEMPVTR